MTNTTKRLAELDAGDVILTNEGRREWMRIIRIGVVQGQGEFRPALIEQVGGKRKGSQFPMNLHDYARGWVVKR